MKWLTLSSILNSATKLCKWLWTWHYLKTEPRTKEDYVHCGKAGVKMQVWFFFKETYQFLYLIMQFLHNSVNRFRKSTWIVQNWAVQKFGLWVLACLQGKSNLGTPPCPLSVLPCGSSVCHGTLEVYKISLTPCSQQQVVHLTPHDYPLLIVNSCNPGI